MTLLSPWSLVWLAGGVIILALYLLKPRSRRVEVSSTWLWLGAVKEESARSPLQWLKRHFLLLLQLLVALLAALVLARPSWQSRAPVGRTVVFAIDTSAAMLANDGDPGALAVLGKTSQDGRAMRIDDAKAQAITFMNRLRDADRVIVLSMARQAEVVAQGRLPADRGALRDAVARLRVQPSELDLPYALEVAGGLTQSARQGEIVIFTGGVADVAQLGYRPPVAIQVAQVGQGSADNQAITALEARRSSRGELEVFVRVTNYGDQPAAGALRVKVDGEVFQETPMSLPARKSQELLLTEFPPTAGLVEAAFDRRDLLALDNVSTTAVAVPPVRQVLLVGGRSDQLKRALRAVPGVELSEIDPQRYDPKGEYDIYVFEGWFPPAAPVGHWILVDPPARGGGGILVGGTLGRRSEGGREVNDAQIMRVLPSPILQGVDLTGTLISEAKRVRLPDWAEEVVSGRAAPLIFMGYPRPYRAVVFAFDLRSTNLFGRIGFPILIANSVNWLTGDLTETNGIDINFAENRFTPGDSLLIQPLPRATRVEIETPLKRRYSFDGSDSVRFLDTTLPGAYVVTQFSGSEQITRRTYVASVLQPSREGLVADLRARPEIANVATIGGGQAAPILLGPGVETVHSEWWRALAVTALLGLAAEWWWFHR